MRLRSEPGSLQTSLIARLFPWIIGWLQNIHSQLEDPDVIQKILKHLGENQPRDPQSGVISLLIPNSAIENGL